MRDPNRMYDFLEKIRIEWSKAPDLRFGQLLFNFFSESGDPFYWEEDKFIEKLKNYMDGCTIAPSENETSKDEVLQKVIDMAKDGIQE